MTTLTAPCYVARTTRFERMLLTTAAGIDRFVAMRRQRRASASRTVAAQAAAVEARTDARALGSIGILPR